jgi:dihydrofolate reductase
MNMTLDGFISGSDCELDWHFQSWNEEMALSLSEQLSQADTILLGRNTYNAMAEFWPAKIADPSFPREDVAFADMMNNYAKIVFSTSLKNTSWNNSKVLRGNIEYEVPQLKHQQGKDILVFGSCKLVSALVKLGLVDEYHIWMHPVFLGKGKPLFRNLRHRLNMELFKMNTFKSGVVKLYYKSQ